MERPAAISTQNYLVFVTVPTTVILLHKQFILSTMHMIFWAWAVSCFWCPKTLPYSRLGESPRWQCSRWQDQTRAHINLLFLGQWLSVTFKEFWTPVAIGRLAVQSDGNIQIQMAILGELNDTKRWLIDKNEANKQHFYFIGWEYHIGDWTPHIMTKTVEIGQNWL